MNGWELPPAQGLYRPEHEHDACGVGFIAHIGDAEGLTFEFAVTTINHELVACF